MKNQEISRENVSRYTKVRILIRGAGGGGAGRARALQVLGYQLILFGPRGADYAHHITTAPPHLFRQCGVSVQYIIDYENKASMGPF